MKVLAILSDQRVHKTASPALHNTVIQARNLEKEYCYVPLEIHGEDLAEALAGLRALNIAGANVTIPYKERVGEFLDEVSASAKAAGAINTIIRRGDKLIGDNTDIIGYIDSLKFNNINPKGKKVCIVGNGGAARGLIVGLKQAGAEKIIIAGRSADKASTLAKEFNIAYTTIAELETLKNSIDIITNTTPISTAEESPELAEFILNLDFTSLDAVVDINYGRANTFWESLAKRTGAVFIDGQPMLALQGRAAFEMWTGIKVTEDEYLKSAGIVY